MSAEQLSSKPWTHATILDALQERLGITSPVKGLRDHWTVWRTSQCCWTAGGQLSVALSHGRSPHGADIVTRSGLSPMAKGLHPFQRALYRARRRSNVICTPVDQNRRRRLKEVEAGWPSAVMGRGEIWVGAERVTLDDERDPRADEREPVSLRGLRQHRAGHRRGGR